MSPRLVLGVLLAAGLAAPVRAADRDPRFLLIGDSHTVGPFGTTLDKLLRKKFGPSVGTYAVCGASLRWWQSSSRSKLSICYFLRPFKSDARPGNGAYPAEPPAMDAFWGLDPDVLIVALGSNPDGASVDDTITAGAKLLSRLPEGAACFWVGPPPMPSRLMQIDAFYKAFPDMLKRSGKQCTLIDSRAFLRPEQSQKDHFYGQPAVDWGQSVFNKIVSELLQ